MEAGASLPSRAPRVTATPRHPDQNISTATRPTCGTACICNKCSSAGSSRCLARLAPPAAPLPPLRPHRAHRLAVGLLQVIAAQLHSRVRGGGHAQRRALAGLRGGSAGRPQRVDAASRRQPRRQPAAAAEAHGLALHHLRGLHPAGGERALHLWLASVWAGTTTSEGTAYKLAVRSTESGSV